ncbi:MAG: alanine racemase [Gammaproteobacteria bacterium]|nr:alanine racemase [Gammaproteobacteria bacterium]
MTQQKTWEPPALVPHRAGIMNKFGDAPPQSSYQSDIDGVEIAQLREQYGSPLFIVSEKTLRENARRLRQAFASRWPKVRHGWSYKTNYNNAVCNIMHQEGSWAEVVSDFEYLKARALGVPGSHIIFNGPWKPNYILEQAVREGALINIDHLDELFALEQIASNQRKQVSIGIRLNFATGYTEAWSRFGFNIESGAAMNAVQRIHSSPWLKLIGLHSHIGTFVLDTRAYAVQARIMGGFMDKVERDYGCEIEYLDIGGGFASRNSLQGAYLPADLVVPTFDDYAEAIVNALKEITAKRSAEGKPLPTLILETGRAMVDDAETLVTTVVGNKRLPDGRRATILDAGLNLLFTAFWYNHEIKPLRHIDSITEETVLYGPLCMNIDVVRASIMLPALSVGEALTIRPVGAYNNTQWMQFIQFRPAVVMITQEGEVELVRAPETMQMLNDMERLPETLRHPFPAGLPE